MEMREDADVTSIRRSDEVSEFQRTTLTLQKRKNSVMMNISALLASNVQHACVTIVKYGFDLISITILRVK